MEGLRRLEGRLEWGVDLAWRGGRMRKEGWYDTLKCSAEFVVMKLRICHFNVPCLFIMRFYMYDLVVSKFPSYYYC